MAALGRKHSFEASSDSQYLVYPGSVVRKKRADGEIEDQPGDQTIKDDLYRIFQHVLQEGPVLSGAAQSLVLRVFLAEAIFLVVVQQRLGAIILVVVIHPDARCRDTPRSGLGLVEIDLVLPQQTMDFLDLVVWRMAQCD